MTIWLWWSLGFILGLTGLIVLVRGLFADRSRGRRRCAKCWYRLEGLEHTKCPECGCVAKSPRALLRTRRRWRRAAGGLVLIACGLAAVVGHQVKQHGWVGAVPTFAYIALLPQLDPATTRKELETRVVSGDLRQWEYRFLADRGLGIVETETDVDLVVSVMWLLAEVEERGRDFVFGFSSFGRAKQPGKSWARVASIDRDRALRALFALLDHDDRQVRHAARTAIASMRDRSLPAFPGVVARLAFEPLYTGTGTDLLRVFARHWMDTQHDIAIPMGLFRKSFLRVNLSDDEIRFYRAVVYCELDVDQILAVCADGLDSESEEVRVFAVLFAGLLGSDRANVREQILMHANDARDLVRLTVVRALSLFPYDERVEAALARAFHDNDEIRIAAARVTALQGPAASGLLAHLETGLAEADLKPPESSDNILRSTSDRSPLVTFAHAHAKVSGQGDTAAAALLAAGRRDPSSLMSQALHAIGKLDVDCSLIRSELEPLLCDSEPFVRIQAAFALAMTGGDLEEPTRVLMAEPFAWSFYFGVDELTERGRLSTEVLQELLDSSAKSDQAAAATVLGRMGATAALPRLRELTKDDDPKVVRAANEAILTIESR